MTHLPLDTGFGLRTPHGIREMLPQDVFPGQSAHHARDACLCLHVRRAARMLARRYDDALRPLELTNGQFSLMIAIDWPAALTIGAVSALLGMDRTTLNVNLKPLEKRDLVSVVADMKDRRSRRLMLTPHGRALLAEAVPLWERTQASIEGLVGDSDPERLRKDLRALS